MNTFKIGTSGLDIRLSVLCGQVFRWRELSDGRLIGVDGDHWWLVELGSDEATVTGSGELADFRRLFRMDEDWVGYESTVREKTPELAPFLDALPGLRLLHPSSVVEETFSFLCTSNNHLSRIRKMVDRLSEYGEPMAEVEGLALQRFPSVEQIAAISETELREHKFGYRASTIPEAARQIIERGGRGWLEGLRSPAKYEDARMALMELSGVGPKLADCICLFALGHTEAVPVDTHVWQAGCRLWYPHLVGTSLSERRSSLIVDSLHSRLGPLSGWAHQFLFYENLLNWRTRPKDQTKQHKGPNAYALEP